MLIIDVPTPDLLF